MFTEDRDKWDVLLGGIVVAILLVIGHYWMKNRQPQEAGAQAVAATSVATMSPRVEFADGSIKSDPNAPIASVYECVRDGQRILSDQPCGSDASIREIAEPNRMDAQDTRALYSPVYFESRRSRGSAAGSQPSGTSTACDSIEDGIDAINARMRQPYTSWQGERFREQLRELSRQRYEAKCIR